MDENLAAVHAYLCADGYVIKNPPTQKQHYYHIGLRGTNLTLLKDFQDRFEKAFGIKPHLIEGQRCRIGSKEIYEELTKEFGSFYSWEWRMPKLDDNIVRIWLRAYFDCEGWVTCKTHQNRQIGADCVNKEGIFQVKAALKRLGIACKVKKRNTREIYSLAIFGKENLSKFKDKIGFLHPKKVNRLILVMNDFMVYEWTFPSNKEDIVNFIKEIMHKKSKINHSNGIIRIFSNKECNLSRLQKLLKELFDVESKVNKRKNGIGTIYYEMNINKKSEINKLINSNLLNKELVIEWQKLKSRK